MLSSIIKSPMPAALATSLVLAGVFSPLRTLAQTPNAPSDATPPMGCISGYPDGTFRGDRAVTRYEFAAGLNACLDQVNQLIPINRGNLATKADLEVLIQRQRELNQQLRELSDRVGDIPTNKSTKSSPLEL